MKAVHSAELAVYNVALLGKVGRIYYVGTCEQKPCYSSFILLSEFPNRGGEISLILSWTRVELLSLRTGGKMVS